MPTVIGRIIAVTAVLGAAVTAIGIPAAAMADAPPVVSEPFDVSDPVFGPDPDESQDAPAVAWNGDLFLTVYGDGRCDCLGASRLSADGTVLDPAGLFFEPSAITFFEPQVVWVGTAFLVTFEAGSDLHGLLIDANGEAQGPEFVVGTGEGGQFNSRIAWDGSRALVTWETQFPNFDFAVSFTFVHPDGSVDDPVGTRIVDDTALNAAAPAWDGTNFLVTWTDNRSDSGDIYATRITPDGTILDPGGFVVSDAPDQQLNTRAVWTGSNYLLAWQDDRVSPTGIYGARVSPEGAVLDPEGIPLATQGLRKEGPAVAMDGPNALIVWRTSGDHQPEGARVTPAGAVLDHPPIPIGSLRAPNFPNVAEGPGYALVVADLNDIYGWPVDPTGTVGDEIRLPQAANQQHFPVIGSDGSEVIVVWGDQRTVRNGTFGARIDAQGNHLDGTGVELTVGVDDLSWNGGVFLSVAGSFQHHAAAEVRGGRITSDVRVLDPGGFPIAGGPHDQSSPSAASNGEHWLVAYEDRRTGQSDVNAALVRPSGDLARARIPISQPRGNQELPQVVWDGTDYVVVWQDRRDSGDDVYLARVTPAGDVLDPRGIKVADAIDSRPSIAFAGGLAMVTWSASRHVMAARVRPDGTVMDPGGFPIADGQASVGPVVAWDGQAFVVVWQEGDYLHGNLFGVRVTPSGQVLDDTKFPVAASNQTETDPSIVAGPGSGRVSVAYSAFTPSLGTDRVYVRFIDEP